MRVHLIRDAQLEGIDVSPAEARAARRAERDAGKQTRDRVADARDLRVFDPLPVERDRPILRGGQREAHTVGGRGIEAAVTGEQAGVFLEPAERRLRFPGGTHRHELVQVADPAEPHAGPGGALVAVVTDLRRCRGKAREQADALVHAGVTRLEDLLSAEAGDLADIPGIGESAAAILEAARNEAERRNIRLNGDNLSDGTPSNQ